jgi:signal transduction histidine kinase
MVANLIQSAAFRLTIYYLALIMFLSIGFSFIIYRVSTSELERNYNRQTVYFDRILTLLARRTLQPIQDALEAQSRFTSDASHELRTPLTAMQAEIEVALRDKSLTKEDARALLESNLEEVVKLRRLSDRLLQLASADNEMELTPTSLEEVSIEALNRALPQAEAKNILITNEAGPLLVMGNSENLTDVVAILLENAIKYSPPKTTIRVQSQKHGKQALLRVKDQGQGIKASEIPHIFERFYRADQSRTGHSAGGYGLGLAIAKQIVTLHRGDIYCKSTPTKGTTFTVALPLAPAELKAKNAAPRATRKNENKAMPAQPAAKELKLRPKGKTAA